LADTEFDTPQFTAAVRQRQWRAVVGINGNRQLADGRVLKDLYCQAQRGCQGQLAGFESPLTIAWFWLKRADVQHEIRLAAATYPYSGGYLIRLGRRRWSMELFKSKLI
jgi:hypothetical protein